MPRVNVEETIFSDPRFGALTLLLKSQAFAVGTLVLAWRLAQTYAGQGGGDVPKRVFFRLENAQALLDCGLAEIVNDDFISVAGSKKYHAWITRAKEAGRRGGLKSKGNSARLLKAFQPSSSSSSSSSAKRKTLLPPQRENSAAAAETVPSDDRFAELRTPGNRDLLARVDDRAIASWVLIYPIEFIKHDSERAAAWLAANPARAPRKNFGAFLGRWLDRSWEKERKIPQPARGAPKTLSTAIAPIDVSFSATGDFKESD